MGSNIGVIWRGDFVSATGWSSFSILGIVPKLTERKEWIAIINGCSAHTSVTITAAWIKVWKKLRQPSSLLYRVESIYTWQCGGLAYPMREMQGSALRRSIAGCCKKFPQVTLHCKKKSSRKMFSTSSGLYPLFPPLLVVFPKGRCFIRLWGRCFGSLPDRETF